MKLKHLITLATSCGILVVLAGLGWTWVVFKEEVPRKRPSQMAALNRLEHIPGPEVIRRMVELEDFMKGLHSASMGKNLLVDLSAFGDERVQGGAGLAEAAGRGRLLIEEFPYRVSFAFSAGTTGFCVINGTFYKKGAKTEGGLRILDVKADSVLLEKNGAKHWVPVVLSGIERPKVFDQTGEEG